MVVTEGIHDRFVKSVTEQISALVVDDALKPGTQIGPAVDQRQLDQNLKYVAIGQEEGANRAFGGDRLNRDTPGFYLSPCLLTETTNDMRVNREEIFGPVGTVIRVKDYEEALACRQRHAVRPLRRHRHHLAEARDHFRANAQAGMVMVNLPDGRRRLPRAVRRPEGFQLWPPRQGRYAAEFYTTVKTSYILP